MENAIDVIILEDIFATESTFSPPDNDINNCPLSAVVLIEGKIDIFWWKPWVSQYQYKITRGGKLCEKHISIKPKVKQKKKYN